MAIFFIVSPKEFGSFAEPVNHQTTALLLLRKIKSRVARLKWQPGYLCRPVAFRPCLSTGLACSLFSIKIEATSSGKVKAIFGLRKPDTFQFSSINHPPLQNPLTMINVWCT
jgi:hypothetical protein